MAVGGIPQPSANAELKRRKLLKPDANAICVTVIDVSVSSCFASSSRRVVCTAIAVAPVCSINTRRNCLPLSPTLAASDSIEISSKAPSAINPKARWTACSPQVVSPGASSGRQRKQGLYPAVAAAAAVGK